MTSFNFASYELHEEEDDVAVRRYNFNTGVGTLLCEWLIISPK